ncbi:hypothetical protein C8R46DRAFT_1211150 [Mycena filopes]|nr:hypothetical protein C8R46DRAFT_1211150 [Mycena filopes]
MGGGDELGVASRKMPQFMARDRDELHVTIKRACPSPSSPQQSVQRLNPRALLILNYLKQLCQRDLLDEENLLKYARANGLGRDADIWETRLSIGAAAEDILHIFGIDPFIIATVMVNDQMKTCAAIASESICACRPRGLYEG